MAAEIRVLVVDDSPTVREFLAQTFNAAAGMKVVAVAATGEQAVEAVRTQRPDVVTMDVKMPGMDGLEATRRIMHEYPVPIVVVSGIFDDQVAASFQALEAGALAFVAKPTMAINGAESGIGELVRTIRLMSEVKVVRRKSQPAPKLAAPSPVTQEVTGRSGAVRVIAVGASTGGPAAVAELLNALPSHGLPPILIVQHIATGFTEGLVTWLSRSTTHQIRQAVHGDVAGAGQVYVAPEAHHLGVNRFGRIVLSNTAPENGLRPAVSHLFRSVLAAYGCDVAAVLLSGMGKDGAPELRDLRVGGAVTFAQDKESALIFGMPGEAIRLEAAQYILSPGHIGAVLAALIAKTASQSSLAPQSR